jgi:hypothetical protein
MRPFIANLLSVCLALFLADAVISLLDDSLILFLGVRVLVVIRAMLFLLAVFLAVVVYGLMALTPTIPKRFFIPVTLFSPVALLVPLPFLIYLPDRIQEVAWGISLAQLLLATGILYWVQGGLRFRWPLVDEAQLSGRLFTWWNLTAFLLVNALVLLPGAIAYCILCLTLAVDHYSEGFLALRPAGLSVQVRDYARSDGKTIQLIPMAHLGESSFYRELAASFPTNATLLMEGVTDRRNLLTNRISYQRMANSLGLAEQQREFKPTGRRQVPADVDVEQFTPNTIGFLNLVMLLHAQGVNAETVRALLAFSPPPRAEEQLWEDLLGKRNRHLLEEIRAQLNEAEDLIVPWGAAHMPEIAREIQKSGFRLAGSREYLVIRFRPSAAERATQRQATEP